MRIYSGSIYPVQGIVRITDEGLSYDILDIYYKGERAYILCGYNRRLLVTTNAKILLYRKGRKTKIISIPFVKDDNNQYVFDLPTYFKSQNISVKLYKRQQGGDCLGTPWNSTSTVEVWCKNGHGGFCSIGYDIRYYVDFDSKVLFINGRAVKYLSYSSADGIGNQAKEAGKKLLFDQHHYSWSTFGEYLESFGLKRANLTLGFFDEKMIRYIDKGGHIFCEEKYIRYIDWTDESI